MTNEGKSLFQCGGFLDRHIGMEPLVIDWAKEVKMAKIVYNFHSYCLLFYFDVDHVMLFSARSIALKECYLMMNSEEKLFYSF